MNEPQHAAEVVRQFRIQGELSAIAAYGSGHINDTYCAVFNQRGVPVRFILQRINTAIFKDPAALMENIQRVTSHLAAKPSSRPESDRRVLTLIPAQPGRAWHVDAEGGYWRVYRFIERARAYDAVESPQQAFQAAKAFAEFQRLLVDLPAPPLHETIPGFHDTPARFAAFEQAVAADGAHRTVDARAEIEFAFARQPIVGLLQAAGLPRRITHNDTKINNVLLDDATGEGICVIDLDTVMPGLALFDFGDMVRTAATGAAEDEQDLSRVTMRLPMFEALARGYLSSASSFLAKNEIALLPFAGKLIAFEQGIRFLTDHLVGDIYYKVHRQGQNLDRCRTQFKLVRQIEQHQDQMNLVVSRLLDELACDASPGAQA